MRREEEVFSKLLSKRGCISWRRLVSFYDFCRAPELAVKVLDLREREGLESSR